MERAFLGLGSNVGDREQNLTAALHAVAEQYPILDYSSVYETDPVGYTDQPQFLNMVMLIDPGDTTPQDLLRFVKQTEQKLGRRKTFRWGPRVIDIDILFFDEVELRTDELSLPHPAVLERNFVLVPLSELTGEITVHGKTRTISRLISTNHDRVVLYRQKEQLLIDR
jgi:2-amino-4-hydroxy-6-hydroxymethyldihydropteridine diphosphokinase